MRGTAFGALNLSGKKCGDGSVRIIGEWMDTCMHRLFYPSCVLPDASHVFLGMVQYSGKWRRVVFSGWLVLVR